MNKDLHEKSLEAIESPLQISLPGLDHRLPTKKEELTESLAILEQIRVENQSDNELLAVLKDEEAWLKEGLELMKDENAIAEILIDKFAEYGTLKISNGNFPQTAEQLKNWKTIFSYLETQKPTDKEIKQTIEDYREFLGYYDAKTANEFAMEEIFNNVYSNEGNDGSKGPANKDEAIRAIILLIKANDWPDIDDELRSQLTEQHETLKRILSDFGVSNSELDTAIDQYVNELEETVNQQGEYFSDENYNSENGQAYQYMDELYHNLSYVDKEGYRWAASAKEVEEGYEFIHKAEAAINDDSDTEIRELITQNKEHLDEANVRRFAGAWWLIVCAGILAIIQLYSAFSTFGTKITPEQAVTYKQNEINSYNNSIKYIQDKPEQTKDDVKRLESFEEKVTELTETSPEKYARKYNGAKRRRGLKSIFWGLVSVAWIVGYYLASRPYGYDRFQRQIQYQRIQKATGWAAKFLKAVLGVFWSIPITTYITKYTDGSEERDSDAAIVLGIQIFVTVAIVGLVLVIAKIIIPFATVIAFIRNYPGKPGAKQVNKLFKDGKGFFQSKIDNIVGKQAA